MKLFSILGIITLYVKKALHRFKNHTDFYELLWKVLI